jgi:hypothetical protein
MAKKKERVVVLTSLNKDMTLEESLEILLKVLQMSYDRAMENQDDNASANSEKSV